MRNSIRLNMLASQLGNGEACPDGGDVSACALHADRQAEEGREALYGHVGWLETE